MNTLRDFLAFREAEIREQMKLLKAELAELKRAKAAVEQANGGDDGGVDVEVRDSPRITIKDMVRSVFVRPDAAKGMAAGEVLDAIDREFKVKLERTSLSPQLSRLRESGDVVLQDGRWFPSEPRLSQAAAQATAVVVNAGRVAHAGGGFGLGSTGLTGEMARLIKSSVISQSTIEEASQAAKLAFATQEMAATAKVALGSTSIGAAAEAALKSASIASVLASAQAAATPNTAKAIVEADRKMREIVHGSSLHETHWVRGSGPKTE